MSKLSSITFSFKTSTGTVALLDASSISLGLLLRTTSLKITLILLKYKADLALIAKGQRLNE